MTTVFNQGMIIERREVLHGQVWLESPVTVVADDGIELAVLLEPGSQFTFPTHPFGLHPWHSLEQWVGPQVLQLYRGGDLYSVWLFFHDGCLRNWYINFEAPMTRHAQAIDTLDYGLDLVVKPDGTTAWKDVEDLNQLRRIGRMTLEEIGEVLEAAEQVSHDLSVDERWWSRWDDWKPPR